mgnify:FL=1|tara:strand:- start:436 stop:840 length:405 start_codon:yes stop_codon:yes gene_type:complete
MESTGKFEDIFYKLLENNTAGPGGSLGDGESMHDITKYADGDARKPTLLGKVVSRAGTVGGKKEKKKKNEVDGLDGVYLTGENEETLPEEDAEKKKKADRCKRRADSVYGKKTSAYKSGAIVRCRQGKIWKKKK